MASPHLLRPRAPIICCAGAMMLVAGCGGATKAPDAVADAPIVMASTSVWADVVSQVGCGRVSVSSVVPAGADSHEFELDAKGTDEVNRADLLVINGLGLEEHLDQAIDSARESGVTVLELAEVIDVPATAPSGADPDHETAEHDHDHDHGEGEGEDHEHGDVDPHIWLDPDLVAATVAPIAEALGSVEGLGLSDDELAECADAYSAQLGALSESMETAFGSMDPQRRNIVTDHAALGHLARRFDLQVIGTVVDSTSSLGEPNPRDLDELAGQMSEHGVTTVFGNVGDPSSLESTLSRSLGTPVTVQALVIESVDPGQGAATYLDMMRLNTERISEG